jgi:hypothetical protein
MALKPFRLVVQERLSAALEGITIANGFETDLGPGKVFRGRLYFGERDPVPMVSILEEPIAAETDLEPSGGTGGTTPYILMVQGFASDDPVHPTDPAHFLMADVKRVLAEVRKERETTDRVLAFPEKAPTVTDITFGAGVVRPPDDLSAKAYFWLRVTIELVEDNDKPYMEV